MRRARESRTRRTKLPAAGWAVVFAPALLAAAQVPADLRLRGDEDAVAAVERMLEAVGGAELWSASRTLELEYRAWIVEPEARRITERAWRDLGEPNQRIELRSETAEIVAVLTPISGWRTRDGALVEVPEERWQRDRVFWPRDFYTLFHRFATRDPDLSLLSSGDRRVVVHSDRQGEIGWFEIASDGAPVRWGTVDGGEPLEYVYGPLRDFDPLRYPAWGASLDGSWRFEYVGVALRPGPIPPPLLAHPPSAEGERRDRP